MDKKSEKKTNIQPVEVPPQPVIIMPSKQYDFRNFRHYSEAVNFLTPTGFVLDVPLTDQTYLGLVKFETRLLYMQNINGHPVTKEFFSGFFDLEIKKVVGSGPAAVEFPLGNIKCSLEHDILEGENMVWDSAVQQILRFKVQSFDLGHFTYMTFGTMFPAETLDINMVMVLMRFTFAEYPKSLFQFSQTPNIYL